MENKHRTALKSFGKGQGKDKYLKGQKQIIFIAFYTTNPELFPIVEPSKFKGNE